ncbi:MAG: DEAD/DEAH box helicase [Bacteroidetes bacterium]|nr:DEAD/DEAH box helicase [Bacteroidota bacterium]
MVRKIIPNVDQIKDDSHKIKTVNEAIKDKFVRTTKNELGLKEPIIKYSHIPLGPIQSELYSLLKSEAARLLANMDKNNKETFRRTGKSVMRLLQAATNPMLLGTDDEYRDNEPIAPLDKQVWFLIEEFTKYEKPVKIEFLKNRVNEILSKDKKNKIVIWSSFVRNIVILEKLFKEYDPVSIYGAIPSGSDDDEEKREGRIRKFHESSSCRIIVANPQACGEGISLHKVCHNAIYLDRTFNAAHFLQSVDRIHRLGLSNEIDTNVEILVSKETIDEVLIRRLNEKIENMGQVLNDKYLTSLAYDPFDIRLEDENGIDSKDFEEIKNHIVQ